MAGLVPAIHVLFIAAVAKQDVDARHKAGHDVERTCFPLAQGSLSKPSPKPFRLIGKPMPSSGVWKIMKVADWPVRNLLTRLSSMTTSATQPLGTHRTKPARPT